jgi:hypothetical protein
MVKDSAVLIDICFMGMRLTGGIAQKVGTNEPDNRRIGHSEASISVSNADN